MYKYYLLLISLFITLNCSSRKQLPSYYEQESIDSTNIVASIQPLNYPWNSEGHLIDLLRKKYDANPPFISPFSIIFNFEDIKPDTFTVYFCFTHRESCVKIVEQYFNKGFYSLGFQKLNIEMGWYEIKFVGSDVEYSQQYFIVP